MKQDNIWAFWQNEGVESFAGSLPRLRYLVHKIPSRSRALNIGIGNADMEKLSLEKGIDIYSLDPDAQTVERVSKALGLDGRASSGRVEDLPFDDGFFDYVIMSEVLEHLDQPTRQRGLSEVVRVLKPEGKFLGTVPDRENLGSNLTICPHCNEQFHRWGHVDSFDASKLQEELGHIFPRCEVESIFFAETIEDGISGMIKGMVKRLASRLDFGPYGQARNLVFEAHKS